MKLEFTLPIKAFSINAYRYGHTPHKTKEARSFEEDFLWHISQVSDILEMADKWRTGDYGQVHVSIVHVYPKDVFFNKQGKVSAKTFDLSNTEKILLDLILNKYMEIDDRFVTVLNSSKIPGAAYEIRVSLEMVPGPSGI